MFQIKSCDSTNMRDNEIIKEYISEPDWDAVSKEILSSDNDIQYSALYKVRRYVGKKSFDIKKVFDSGIVSPLVNLLSDTISDNNLVYCSVFNFCKE